MVEGNDRAVQMVEHVGYGIVRCGVKFQLKVFKVANGIVGGIAVESCCSKGTVVGGHLQAVDEVLQQVGHRLAGWQRGSFAVLVRKATSHLLSLHQKVGHGVEANEGGGIVVAVVIRTLEQDGVGVEVAQGQVKTYRGNHISNVRRKSVV